MSETPVFTGDSRSTLTYVLRKSGLEVAVVELGDVGVDVS